MDDQDSVDIGTVIAAGRSANGGWTRAQLAIIGVPWPPPKGWKAELLASGARVGPEVFEQFVGLKGGRKPIDEAPKREVKAEPWDGVSAPW